MNFISPIPLPLNNEVLLYIANFMYIWLELHNTQFMIGNLYHIVKFASWTSFQSLVRPSSDPKFVSQNENYSKISRVLMLQKEGPKAARYGKRRETRLGYLTDK